MATRTRRSSDFQEVRRRIVGTKATQEENVIPMINIIFLLLLFFMVAGNLQPDFDVAPPISQQENEAPQQIPTVAITREGGVRFENRPVDLDQLRQELARIAGHERIKIHADAKVDALAVSKVMTTATETGVTQFVLVTQRRAAGG
jgi:biopolymer transport protein ExbD